jgi:hypothetical protein
VNELRTIKKEITAGLEKMQQPALASVQMNSGKRLYRGGLGSFKIFWAGRDRYEVEKDGAVVHVAADLAEAYRVCRTLKSAETQP